VFDERICALALTLSLFLTLNPLILTGRAGRGDGRDLGSRRRSCFLLMLELSW
jgi:hypothetical protein